MNESKRHGHKSILAEKMVTIHWILKLFLQMSIVKMKNIIGNKNIKKPYQRMRCVRLLLIWLKLLTLFTNGRSILVREFKWGY
jgi:hypothetical protein